MARDRGEAVDRVGVQEEKAETEEKCSESNKEYQTKLDKIEMYKSYSSCELDEDLAVFDDQTAWVDPESPPGEEGEQNGDTIILL